MYLNLEFGGIRYVKVIIELWMRKTDGIAIKYSSQVASISIFSLGLPIFLYELKDI